MKSDRERSHSKVLWRGTVDHHLVVATGECHKTPLQLMISVLGLFLNDDQQNASRD
jgi:hypothetical protein